MNVKLNEHYKRLLNRPLPSLLLLISITLTLGMKIHKSSQRAHARTLEMSKTAKRWNIKTNAVYVQCPFFFSPFVLPSLTCFVRFASQFCFMRIIYFSCFLFTRWAYLSIHLQMHAKRTNETKANVQKNGKIHALFLKSNQYSVVTRRPKLPIHVFLSIIHIMLAVHVKLTPWKIHKHKQQNVWPSLFLFFVRIARVGGKNGPFCVGVNFNSSCASSVIRHWLSHPFYVNDILTISFLALHRRIFCFFDLPSSSSLLSSTLFASNRRCHGPLFAWKSKYGSNAFQRKDLNF